VRLQDNGQCCAVRPVQKTERETKKERLEEKVTQKVEHCYPTPTPPCPPKKTLRISYKFLDRYDIMANRVGLATFQALTPFLPPSLRSLSIPLSFLLPSLPLSFLPFFLPLASRTLKYSYRVPGSAVSSPVSSMQRKLNLVHFSLKI